MHLVKLIITGKTYQAVRHGHVFRHQAHKLLVKIEPYFCNRKTQSHNIA